VPELPRELRIVVRPYATALPLGFFSFGVGMLILAGLGNGWLPASEQHTAGLLLAAFVFPLETIAVLFAFLEDVQKKSVLPVFRRGSSRDSLEGDLTDQLERIADEAGVRQTL
jgi:hypothetical protein